MPAPPLAAPRSVPSLVFRAVVATLQQHPVLRRLGITWRVWDGSENEWAEPTVDECPWVRLTPQPEAVRFTATGVHEANLVVLIETLTAGSRADDAMDLWQAIVGALYPGDQSFYRRLQAAGAFGYELLQASPAPYSTGDGAAIAATGQLRCLIQLPTQP